MPKLVLAALVFSLLSLCRHSSAQQTQGRVVRLAELEIEPAQLEGYKAALKEEIDASIRVEPGVLTLYAVAFKDDPRQIRLFEIYADMPAYKAHLEAAHFKKYKAITQGMVKSLKLVETDPIELAPRADEQMSRNRRKSAAPLLRRSHSFRNLNAYAAATRCSWRSHARVFA
jgi:quinol monooxygenase YgiN